VGTWDFDPPHTYVGFVVRHLVVTKVRGRFEDVEGHIVTAENPLDSSVEVSVDLHSVNTNNEMRDNHLRSADFFDVEKFPTLTFKSRRVDQIKGDTFKLVGDLTIKDVTREVVLDVTSNGFEKDPWGGERTGFSARTAISRKDFGLLWNQILETGGLAVGDDVKITLDVELVKS
jgi:polyisoprenoid-binding protein YceI